MSERDLTKTEATRHPPSDNDVFSESFDSMLDPRFALKVKSEQVDFGEPRARGAPQLSQQQGLGR